MKKRNIVKYAVVVVVICLLCMVSACADTQESESLLFFVEQEIGSVAEPEELHYQNTGEQLADSYSSDSIQKIAVVHICGEVLLPGVYEVPADARIYDVVQIAGGFTEAASEDYLNLALPVTDGMKIVILSEEEAKEESVRKETSGLININTATEAELCTLPGIGKSRAADIITYRNKHGGFASTEEIMKVSGIKSAMYEKLKDKIYVE